MDDNNNQSQSLPPTLQPLPSTPQPEPSQPIPPQTISPQPIPPKKGLSKGALWGIIGGVLGLILVITAVVLAVIFLAGPSKEDYMAMRSQVKDVKTQSKNTKEKTKTFIDNMLEGRSNDDSLKEALNDYKEAIDNMKDMKALQDKDVKKSYDELVKNYADIKEYVESIMATEKKIQMAVDKCDSENSPSIIRKFSSDGEVKSYFMSVKKFLQRCTDVINDVPKSKSKELNNFFKTAADIYKEQIIIVDEALQSINDRDLTKYNSALRKFVDHPKRVPVIVEKLKKNIQVEVDDQKDAEKISALEKTINDKIK